MTSSTARSDSDLQGHTPTPWAISHGYGLKSESAAVYVAGPEPKQIGIKLQTPWIEGAWDGDPEAEANARFIVHAVNCHDDLLSQLQFAVKLLGALPALNGTAQVQSMRDTIAKARGAS